MPMDKLTIGDREVDAIFFFHPTGTNDYLSNWYPSPFEIDGVRFVSMEQYIMYKKSIVFGDAKTASAILATDKPAAHKKLGRRASGYVNAVWGGIRQLVALRGLLAKFGQNAELKEKLFATGDAWLVESSRFDVVWACGCGLNDSKRLDVAQWRGTNILGFALMEARDVLRTLDAQHC